MDESDVDEIRSHPDVMVGSDGLATAHDAPLGKFTVHPRYYGTFPRVLGRSVREKGLLSLEDAVAAMTSLVADRFSLAGRGRLAAGSVADLVVFDADRIIDTAKAASIPLQHAVHGIYGTDAGMLVRKGVAERMGVELELAVEVW